MSSRTKLTLVVAVLVSALLVGAGIAAALTPKAGSYLGQTAQNQLVGFRVGAGGKTVSRFRVQLVVRCGSDRYLIPLRLSWSERISPQGRFTYYGAAEGVSIRVVGKFGSPRRARGTARFRLNDPDVGSCDSGIVGWRARRR